MHIENHRLSGTDITHHTTPNTSGLFESGLPDTVVIHYTAGRDAQSSVTALCDPATQASAHIVIGRDGALHQLAGFDTVCWHAGRSQWQGRSGLNRYSIGIELDNAGPLQAVGNGQYESWFKKRYREGEVVLVTHRHTQEVSAWHAYSEAQITALFSLCRLLCLYYNITDIVGHEDISPGRKTDPGPAFPMARLQQHCLGEGRRSDAGLQIASVEPKAEQRKTVSVPQLNVRSGPGRHQTMIAPPLTGGEKVTVTEQTGQWSKIRWQQTGWVASRYLR